MTRVQKAGLDFSGKTILVSAGGTGGHVYPALVVADALRQQGATVAWLGTPSGLESRLVPQAKIPFYTIWVQGLRGNGLKRLIKAPWVIARSVRQARQRIKKIKPDIYLGFGGFASGPGALAAKLSGVPVVLHEQNAAMGLTNRLVGLWAKRVLLAFPLAERGGHVVGNPIRQEISEIPPPSQRMRVTPPYRILVVGGSLGAQAINAVVPQALLPLLGKVTLTHQTGKTTYDTTLATYQQLGIADQVTVLPYIDKMEKAYAEADLLIARAGALTVSEAASVGLPAIFIPLPQAVDNHQYLNASFLAEAEAARIIKQKDLTADSLRQVVSDLLDSDSLVKMAEKARQQSHAQATNLVTTIIKEVIDG